MIVITINQVLLADVRSVSRTLSAELYTASQQAVSPAAHIQDP